MSTLAFETEPGWMEAMLPEHDLTSGNPIRRFLRGASYVLRGARFVVGRPGLYPYLVWPALIVGSLMLTAGVGTVLGTYWIMAELVQTNGHAVLAVLGAVSFFVLSMVTSYLCAGFIAIPFNDRLSVEVERITTGREDEDFDWSVFFTDLRRSLAHSFLSLCLWLVMVLLLLPLHLVPGVGSVIHAVASMSLTATLASREMMDGAMSRRRMSYGHKWRVIRSNKALLLGMGAASGLLVAIPVLGFFLLPIAVSGGTLMFNKLEQDGLVPEVG